MHKCFSFLLFSYLKAQWACCCNMDISALYKSSSPLSSSPPPYFYVCLFFCVSVSPSRFFSTSQIEVGKPSIREVFNNHALTPSMWSYSSVKRPIMIEWLINLRRTRLWTSRFVDCGWISCSYFSYTRFDVYPAQHVGELLIQRQSGHAIGTVFWLWHQKSHLVRTQKQNTRQQSGTEQTMQYTISVGKKRSTFWGPIYILWAPNTGTFNNYLLQ